jgi:hypothetical protein
MPETERQLPRKPQIKGGDIVLVSGSWYFVDTKSGQRCTGRLLVKPLGQRYRFTTRQVERVFRELGKSTKGSGQSDR